MTALSDFDTLADAQAYEETTYKTVDSSTFISYMAQNGLIDLLENDTSSTFKAVRYTLACGGVFSFNPGSTPGSTNIAMLDALIANTTDYGDYTANLESVKAALISYAGTTTTPFADATESDFNAATGNYLTEVSTSWSGEKFLTVTLAEDLTESVKPYVTVANDVYTDEPLNRSSEMLTTGTYTITLAGLTTKYRPGKTNTITVHFPCECTATVAAV